MITRQTVLALFGQAVLAQTGPPRPKIVATWGSIAVDYAPVWIADRAGLFASNGIDVELQYLAGSSQIVSLLAGQTQIATVGGLEIVSADAAGGDLIVVATISPIYPYEFIVPSAVRTPGELRGKIVGVTRFGDISDIAARAALRHLGLEPSQVAFVQVGSASNRVAAMLGGTTQAGVFQPPTSSLLFDHGFHSMLDLAKLRMPTALCVTARRDWVDAHRPAVQAYVDAIVAAITKEKHDRPFTIALLKEVFKSSDDDAMSRAYTYYVREVVPTIPLPAVEQFTDGLEELVKTNPKVRGFNVAGIIDDSFVRAAAKKYRLR